MSDYCERLETSPLKALDQGARRLDSVPLLLSRSLEQVSDEAQQTLAVSGWLALNPFPVEAVAAALTLDDRFAAFNLLGELMAYGLAASTDDGYVLSHALIHTYARKQLALAHDARERLVTWFTDEVDQNPRNFPTSMDSAPTRLPSSSAVQKHPCGPK
ncbi:MAG: hypothetical protein AAF702_08095 [Chloroflexota bacterium]